MYKRVGTEIVVDRAAYDDWRQRRDQLLVEHGMEPIKVWNVDGRTARMTFFETPEFENTQEFDEWRAQYSAATRSLVRRGQGVVLPGSLEWYILTTD